jgi:hypothetical protein
MQMEKEMKGLLALAMVYVAGAREPARHRLATTEALYRASLCEVLCVGKSF